ACCNLSAATEPDDPDGSGRCASYRDAEPAGFPTSRWQRSVGGQGGQPGLDEGVDLEGSLLVEPVSGPFETHGSRWRARKDGAGDSGSVRVHVERQNRALDAGQVWFRVRPENKWCFATEKPPHGLAQHMLGHAGGPPVVPGGEPGSGSRGV